MPATIKLNKKNNSHRSELTKSDRKGHMQNLPKKALQTQLKVPWSPSES